MRVTVTDLVVERGGRRLTRPLSFIASPGTLVAVTGPNGAGKTTLLRTLAGLARPAAGSVAFDACADPEELPAHVHLLGHRDGLKPALPVAAHLTFWAGVLGGAPSAIAPALAQVGLARFAALPARSLSQGQGRRLALARLIVCHRPVWLLDEPAAGLDAAGRTLLDGLIAAHLAAGGAVVAALHEPLGVAAALDLPLERPA